MKKLVEKLKLAVQVLTTKSVVIIKSAEAVEVSFNDMEASELKDVSSKLFQYAYNLN